MKRLFSKKRTVPISSGSDSSSPSANPVARNTGLSPKLAVPPGTHPRPYDHIAVLPTKDGLLLRPRIEHAVVAGSCIRLGWARSPRVEELEGNGESYEALWGQSVIVYGIVGILDLFTGTPSLLSRPDRHLN